MEALHQLRLEHALIDRMLDHLGQSLEPFDELEVARGISFFANYDDLYHRAKEEDVLFAELLARAGEVMAGSIQVMRKEHTLARAYVAKAQEVYADAVGGDRRSMQLLLRCLRSFMALEREHIKKEEVAIFGPCEQILPPSLDQYLLVRFAEVTSNTIDAQAKVLYEEFGLLPPPHVDHVSLDRDREPTKPTIDASRVRASVDAIEQIVALRGPNPLDPRSLAPKHHHGRGVQTIVSARRNRVLFEREGHRALLLHDFGEASLVQSNQYLIVSGDNGMLLDPGGPKVYPSVLAETNFELQEGELRYIFFSHEDPDVCTSMNAWLMDTRADAYVSQLWVRFLTHFGVDELLEHRLKPIPDEGIWLPLGDSEVAILPAHFLHSCGNFQVYDPVSKVLFTGDLGSSMAVDYPVVKDFGHHIRFMKPFHERFMAGNAVLRRWSEMVRTLDIEVIAPQHGAVFEGKAMVEEFIAWCESLECGVDLMLDGYVVPPRNEEERRTRALRKHTARLGSQHPSRAEAPDEPHPQPRPSSELH